MTDIFTTAGDWWQSTLENQTSDATSGAPVGGDYRTGDALQSNPAYDVRRNAAELGAGAALYTVSSRSSPLLEQTVSIGSQPVSNSGLFLALAGMAAFIFFFLKHRG